MTLTPQFMYFLGWLWSDGYLLEKQNRITLEIVSEDLDKIYIPNEFKIYNRQRKNRKPQSTAYISSKILYDFLIDNGYKNKQIPSYLILNHKYTHYWYLGVVDGDGCWYLSKNNYCRQFNVCSNYEQNWDYFTKLLENLNCKHIINRRIHKNSKSSIIRISNKKDINLFGNYLYQNKKIDNIGLDRKYNKWLQIINS